MKICTKGIYTLQTNKYMVNVHGQFIQTGCKKFTASEGDSFDDIIVEAMDGRVFILVGKSQNFSTDFCRTS